MKSFTVQIHAFISIEPVLFQESYDSLVLQYSIVLKWKITVHSECKNAMISYMAMILIFFKIVTLLKARILKLEPLRLLGTVPNYINSKHRTTKSAILKRQRLLFSNSNYWHLS